MVMVFIPIFYGRNNTTMRHFSDLPPNYGARRFERHPPSHHEMALSPHLAQASAQVPRPSWPTPPSTVTSTQVSPHHQQGSMMPSAAALAAHSSLHCAPFVSMGGERPHTRPHDRSNGSMAPSPATTGVAMPSPRSAPQRHIPLTTLCHSRAWGGKVPECGRMTARIGGWHPPPIPLGRQRHLVPLATSHPLRTWGGNVSGKD